MYHLWQQHPSSLEIFWLLLTSIPDISTSAPFEIPDYTVVTQYTVY